MLKVLLAEDEPQMNNVFKAAISHQGYAVDSVYNGQEALELASQNVYDVILLDIMMPVMDGITTLQSLRENGNSTHVIMLTAMSEIDDRVNGLDAGADDYLTKPISLKELLARLRSLERRVTETHSQNTLSYGNVQLLVSEQELSAQNSVRLASKETKLMTYFMMNAEKPLTTEQIFDYVWPNDDMELGVVYVYVSYLRQKLKAIQADITIEGEENGEFTLVKV